MNSRAKGCRGELEARDLLRRHGYTAERGQQHAGSADTPDVKHDVPGVHIEVKRVEEKAAGTIYDWLGQAIRDAGPELTPVVLHKRNRRDWVVIMRAEDFLHMQQGGW